MPVDFIDNSKRLQKPGQLAISDMQANSQSSYGKDQTNTPF